MSTAKVSEPDPPS